MSNNIYEGQGFLITRYCGMNRVPMIQINCRGEGFEITLEDYKTLIKNLASQLEDLK